MTSYPSGNGGILTTLFPVGDVVVASAKAGAKQLRRLTGVAQVAVGGVVTRALKDYIMGRGREGLIRVGKFLAAMASATKTTVISRVSRAIQSQKQAEALVRVVAEGDEVITRVAAAADDAAARGVANADELAANTVEVLAAAKGLGLDIAKWDAKAVLGLQRYMELLKGYPDKAVKTVQNLATGQASRKWSNDIAEKFFTAVQCLPPQTRGLERFLSDLSRTPNHTQGAYGIMRLICDKVPELAGRTLDDLADIIVETGQEGIDIVTTLAEKGLKEFWEIKYVLNAAQAISERQIKKHIQTKIVKELDLLLAAAKSPAEIVAAMRQIKFKVDVISPNATKAAKEAIVARVQKVLTDEFPQLAKSGFTFSADDVIVRLADPLRDTAKALGAATKY